MKRKTFIHRFALGTGGAVLLPSIGLMQSCKYEPQTRTALTEADIPLLDEIGEAILPTTADSPGAKATEIGKYMVLMYNTCMPTEEQSVFLEGLNELDARSAKTYSTSFVTADSTLRQRLLGEMQKEATAYKLKMKGMEKPLPHYFDLIKVLTISGYFSSKIGMTQARNYLPVPGKFEACIPYRQGDKPWAT